MYRKRKFSQHLQISISDLISNNTDVDQITQKLVDMILQSGIVEKIDGKILKQVIEIKTYDLLIKLGKEINAIDTIELSIKINCSLF